MGFNFDANRYEQEKDEPRYTLIPEGQHRARIKAVVDQDKEGYPLLTKETKLPMIYLVVEVSGFNERTLRHYIVDNEYVNRNLGDILDSCSALKQNARGFNMHSLIGLVGVIEVRHSEYKGKTQESIDYWVRQKDQNLPQEQAPAESISKTGLRNDQPADDDDIPF